MKKRLRWYHVVGVVTLCATLIITSLGVTVFVIASRSSQVAEPEQIAIESQISLSPTYGAANTLVNITGIGYPANSRINLYLTPNGTSASLNNTPAAEALTDEEGRFSIMLQMPATWPDGQPIQDEELLISTLYEEAISETNETQVIVASRVFDYQPVIIQPEISLSATNGGAGTTVTIQTTGFPAGSEVGVLLGQRDGNPPEFEYVTGTANAEGAATLTFALPQNWPDGREITEEQLEIVVITTDDQYRASAGFDYEPILHPTIDSFAPNAGDPGTIASITGSRFRPGAIVQIHVGTSIEDANGRPAYAETMADTEGRINIPFTMPGYWPSGLPITIRNVIVLATAHDGVGYGWAEFAYLSFADPATPTPEGDSLTPAALEVPSPTPIPFNEDDSAEDQQEAEQQEDEDDDDGSGGGNNNNQTGDDAAPSEEAPATEPTLSISPSEAAPGDSVTVTGGGFPAEASVELTVTWPDGSSQVLGNVDTDEAGGFAFTVDLPDTLTAEDAGLVIVTASTDEAAAETSFTLTIPEETEPEEEASEEPAQDPADSQETEDTTEVE